MIEILLGITSSIVASTIFLIFLKNMRPNLVIAPEIAFMKNGNKSKYIFKVINKGRRNIVDIRGELLLVKTSNVHGGAILNTISLDEYEAFIIEKYDKHDDDAKYARRFRFSSDLNAIWEDDKVQFLIFRIYCHDETSGFGKVFTQEYRIKRSSIVQGEFNFGNSLKIS